MKLSKYIRLRALYQPWGDRNYMYDPAASENLTGPYVAPNPDNYHFQTGPVENRTMNWSWSPNWTFFFYPPSSAEQDPDRFERRVTMQDKDLDVPGDTTFLDESINTWPEDDARRRQRKTLTKRRKRNE